MENRGPLHGCVVRKMRETSQDLMCYLSSHRLHSLLQAFPELLSYPLHGRPHFLLPSVSLSMRSLQVPSCTFSLQLQHHRAEANSCPPTRTLEHKPQKGPALLHTDGKGDIALLVSKEPPFPIPRVLCGHSHCLVRHQILRLQNPQNSNSALY